MASTEEINPPLIFETRGAKIISSITNKVVYRTATFLRPLAENVNKAADIPHIPLLCEVFPHHLQQWQSKVLFKGWKCPQKDWNRWVEVLADKHKRTWERSGIYDAILSSTYEVRCNPDVVLGLAEFWSPETSTFLFPWGEATVTLEDTMILGGFSVSGKPVPRFPPKSLVKLVEKMDNQRRDFGRIYKSRKASHGEWLKHYMQVRTNSSYEEEFEHVAFLSLWLSRYVFPQLPADDVVGKYVFPIAAHLSRGTTVALGPAVLASLYRDLTWLKKEAMSFSNVISVAAPFQLLQIWAFERFPSLSLQGRPKAPNSLFRPGGGPRAARWSNVKSKVNLQLVKSTVKLKENFVWLPYADDNPRFKSLARCLVQATELVGIDCKEKYQPQRVAMQFGLDQDIPGRIPHLYYYSFDSREQSISTRRSIEPGVSDRYSRWWKDSLYDRGKVIREIVARKRSRISSSANAIGLGRRRPEKLGTATARRFQAKRYKRSSSPAHHCRKDYHHPRISRCERNEDEIDLLPISMLPIKRSTTTAASNLNRENVEKPIQCSETNNDHDDTLDFLLLNKRIKRNTCDVSRETKKESPVKAPAADGLSVASLAREPEKESAAEGLPGSSSADNDGFTTTEFEERLRRLENWANLKKKTPDVNILID